MQRVLPEDCGIDPGVQVICRPSCLVTCVLEVFRESRSLRGGERLGRLRGGLRLRARGGERPLQDSCVRTWMDGWMDTAICL